MKPTMKFALSLFMGASILTLVACDNQETKTPEKTTALSENKVESNTENMQVESPANVEAAVANKENQSETVSKSGGEAATAKKEERSVKPVAQPITQKFQAVASQKPVAVEQKVSNKTTKPAAKTATENAQSAYLKEQQRLLKTLESQYQQIQCPSEAEKLNEYSFCRQEERRLFLEIQRVKDEIRLNQ